MRAAALAGAGPQTSGCCRACPAGCTRIQAHCHSERSEESFPLRTKGRLRTMPSKEEKDKRSAVKNLFWARLQILRRSAPQNDNAVFALNHFLSGTHSSARPGRLRGSRFQREPAPGARVETLASALPHQRNSHNVGHACHNCHSERSEESILGKVTDVSLRST